MCGIAGYLDTSAGIDEGLLRRMVARMSHRGPDESGIWVSGPMGLGHARLSILDLSSSHQPMVVGDHAIVFNGEIYNYEALRKELEGRGVSLETQGDTEVLLRGLALDGCEFLQKCDGMFAAAVWNIQECSLLLVRDRFGKKPLFVASPRPGLLVFGSEPKVLLCHPEVRAGLDESALRSLVLHRAIYDGRSAYDDIRQVPPGGTLQVDADGATHDGTWYSFIDDLDRSRSAVENGEQATAEIVEDSIRRRLVADVPVGAFLSGGIDSSIVVAGMRRLAPDSEIRTFSVSFEGDEHDEFSHAAFVADRFKALHERVVVGIDDFLESMPYYSRIRDAPLSEPADVAIGLMSRAARRHVKVVLSGEGADEAYGGYPKYRFAMASNLLKGLLRLCPTALAEVGFRAMGPRSRRVRIAFEAVRAPDELSSLCRWFSAFDREIATALFPRLFVGHAESAFAPQEVALRSLMGRDFDPMQRMQLVDFATWLPGNLLERGDRLTMAEGLEARMPFMSPDVIRHGLLLPPDRKANRRETKLELRRLADSWIGPEISRRRKWGFRVPLRSWFEGQLGDRLLDRIADGGSFTMEFGSRTQVEELVNQHRAGQADHQMPLWTVLAIEEWYQSRMSTSS